MSDETPKPPRPAAEEAEIDDDDYIDEYPSYEEISDEEVVAEVLTKESGKSSSGRTYQVYSPGELLQYMSDLVDQSCNVIADVPQPTMRLLLQHVNWDKEKLHEIYFGGGDVRVQQLFRDARAVNPTQVPTQAALSTPEDINKESECVICCDMKLPSAMHSMCCGHRACLECWSQYLTTKIRDEGMAQNIACVGHNCPILVDYSSVLTLLEDPAVKVKYNNLIVDSFVQAHRFVRWCPQPDCTRAIKAEWVDWKPVTCSCKFTFCFLCSRKWHDPLKCVWLKKWLKKNDDDSETSNWIAANTKECPKCHTTIEKNGGCNHMVCRSASCRHEFCWVCLGAWDMHGTNYYNCNRFNDKNSKNARTEQEHSRAALMRYLFYYNRYMNHQLSLELEIRLNDLVDAKMREMQSSFTWEEVRFLREAVDILRQCRETLMYTYVFAFYLEKNLQCQIFEGNQSDLESSTEQLSGLLERDLVTASWADISAKIKDKSSYCNRRREVLVSHVYEGYERHWWEYTEEELIPSAPSRRI